MAQTATGDVVGVGTAGVQIGATGPGELTVDSGETLNPTLYLNIGEAGDGQLNVQNTGEVNAGPTFVAKQAGSTSSVVVTNGGVFNVGDGNPTSASINIGFDGGAGTANILGVGSTLNVTSIATGAGDGASVVVGNLTDSEGTLTVNSGAVLNVDGVNFARFRVGENGGTGTASITGTASQLNLIASGGSPAAQGSAQIGVGTSAGSDGTLTISDNAQVAAQRADIGVNGGTGSLTISNNAAMTLGGASSTYGNMYVGTGAGSTGTVLIDNANLTVQVDETAQQTARLYSGFIGGSGDITIQNGATVDVIGSQAPGGDIFSSPAGSRVWAGGGLNSTPAVPASSLTVDGIGSTLTANGRFARTLVNADASLNVTGGGSMVLGDENTEQSQAVVGFMSDGELNVEGTGSELRLEAGAAAPGSTATSFLVGTSGGDGVVNIEDGGQIIVGEEPGADSFTQVGGLGGAAGTISIGQNSLFDAGEVLGISHDGIADNFSFGDGQVFLTDSTATLRANEIYIGQGGYLGGIGIVDGNINIDGGILGPGLSPGTLTINGDLTVGNGGFIQLEVAGTNAGEFDVLDISGDADFGTNSIIQFDFIDNFIPDAGDFVDFGVNLTLDAVSNLTFMINGILPDINFSIEETSGGGLRFTANEDGISVPAPGALLLLGLGFLGLGVRRRLA